jgi:hypothetical protein
MARQNAWLQAGYLIVALRAVGLATGPMGAPAPTPTCSPARLDVVPRRPAGRRRLPVPERLDRSQAARTP